jgi:Rps23 Pro-64 3,4-dihydroxylase Tpa1-like proline 4-hydroxylase
MEELIVIDNFIDDAICDQMVEYSKQMYPQMDAVKYDHRRLLKNCQSLEVKKFLSNAMAKISKQLGNNYYVENCWLSIMEKGSFLGPHIDRVREESKDSLAVLFYLNDNFVGGELHFTNLEKTITPRKGLVVIFPCNILKYEHKVNKMTSGTRYAIPLEITLDEKLKVYDI